VFGELAGDEMTIETYVFQDADSLSCLDTAHPWIGFNLPPCDMHPVGLRPRASATRGKSQ
jgi:hypothetical protein